MKKEEIILLVDDEKNNLDIFSKIFTDDGYSVLRATNGNQTFKHLRSSQVDLVLLDVNLGKESGLDILKKIKEDPKINHCYVVMISGLYKSSEDQSTGLEYGADGYFTRPIEKRELLARIESYMRHMRTLKDLKNSEERFRTIIQRNPDAILIVDKDGIIRFANPAAEEVIKLTIDDLLCRTFGYPVLNGESTEINVFRSDAENRIAEMRVIDINWSGRDVLLTSVRDITKHKRIQKKLSDSEQTLRSVIQSLPLPLLIWKENDGDFFLEEFNKSAFESYPGDISKKAACSLDDFYGSGSENIEYIREAFNNKISLRREGRFSICKPEESQFARMLYIYVPSDYVITIYENFTEIEKARNSILAERDRASRYLNIAASIIIALDTNGNITMMNDSGAEILECEKGEALGRNWFETFIPREARKDVKSIFRQILSGEIQGVEYHDNVVLTLKNNLRTIHWHNSILRDELGNISGLLSSGEDITEKLLIEQALSDSETRFVELFRHLHNGVVVYQYNEKVKDFIVKAANEAALKIMRRPIGKVLGMPVKIAFPGIQEMGLWDAFNKVFKTGIPLDFPVTKYSDDQLDLYTENSVYKLPSGEIVAVFSDVSERRRSEDELKKSLLEISRLTEKLDNVREEERKEIAGNLHDDLGQMLTAAKMELSWLKNNLPTEDSIFRHRLNSGIETIDQSVKSVQRISSELRPPVLDNLGLKEAVEQFINDFVKRSGIEVALELPDEQLQLSTNLSISIYRIIQESFTNIARHAQASAAKLIIRKKSNTLEIRIEDNGIGIAKQYIVSSNSLGIIGIKEKVSRYNGNFEIIGSANKGTAVEIILPMEN